MRNKRQQRRKARQQLQKSAAEKRGALSQNGYGEVGCVFAEMPQNMEIDSNMFKYDYLYSNYLLSQVRHSRSYPPRYLCHKVGGPSAIKWGGAGMP